MRAFRILTVLSVAAIGFLTPALAVDRQLSVKHEHLFGDCKGELIFDDQGVRYETRNSKHARSWKYEDLQQIAIDPNKIRIVTYQDRRLHFGADEVFTFDVTAGQVDDSLRSSLEAKLTRPLVSSVLPAETTPKYRIPVKHRKGLGGTQGVLELSDQYLVYRTKDPGDARIWRYGDLVSVGSTGPYQLRITAMERGGWEYGAGKNFVFDLKEKLSDQAYDFLWDKINRPRIEARPPAPAPGATEPQDLK